jgi:drug/metabolite transporter (DMT)-like permease
VRGPLPSLRGRWRWLGAYAVLEIAIPFPLIATGERHLASSLAAIIVAAVPLMIALLALRFEPSERVDRRRLGGAVVGLLLILAGSWLSTDGRLPPGFVRLGSRRRRGAECPAAAAQSTATRS